MSAASRPTKGCSSTNGGSTSCPSYFEHTVVTDEGYNVAYWNLFERELKRGADGYEVNGRPLRFYHYSGFDPLKPYALSKHQVGKMRIRLEDNFDLAILCGRYAEQLLAAGHVETVAHAYRYGYTADGIRIDARARRLYREALLADEARDVAVAAARSVRPRRSRRVRDLAERAGPAAAAPAPFAVPARRLRRPFRHRRPLPGPLRGR